MTAQARTALLTTASFLTVLLATPATAQTAPTVPASPQSSQAQSDGDIVVTARRVVESLQKVPLAVTAVSSAALQRQGIREIRDLSSTVPNLQIKQSNSGGGSVVLTIRGQSQAASIVQYVDPAVGVYVDGLNVPRNVGLKTGLIDIKRVEVLRGPQGTLYGRNTTGGAVSVVTEDPKPTLGAMVTGSIGNYKSWSVGGTLNIPISDGVGLRMTAQKTGRGALGRQVLTSQSLASEDTTYFRAKLKFDRGPFKITLAGDYFDYNGDGQIGKMSGLVPADASSPNAAKYSGRVCLPTATGLTGADPNRLGGTCTPTGGAAGSGTFYGVTGGAAANLARQYLGQPNTAAGVDAGSAYLQQFVQRGNNPVTGRFWDTYQTSGGTYFGDPNYADNTSTARGGSASLNLEYQASDQLTIKSITGWRTWKRYDSYDLDGTPIPIYGTRNGTPYANFYSQELQTLGNFGRLDFVAGLYAGYEDGLDYSPTAQIQAPGALNYSLNDATVINITKAVFAQANYKITDQLTLTLGGRYTQEIRKANIRNRQITSTGGVNCGLPYSLLDNPGGGGAPQGNATNPLGATVAVQCLSSQRTAASEPSWLASINYQATPDVLVYVKASRGFRAGAVQARTNSTVVAAFSPVLPEFVTEFEGGLKSDLFDRRLRLNLAAFYDKYTNAQRTVAGADRWRRRHLFAADQRRLRAAVGHRGRSLAEGYAGTDPGRQLRLPQSQVPAVQRHRPRRSHGRTVAGAQVDLHGRCPLRYAHRRIRVPLGLSAMGVDGRTQPSAASPDPVPERAARLRPAERIADAPAQRCRAGGVALWPQPAEQGLRRGRHLARKRRVQRPVGRRAAHLRPAADPALRRRTLTAKSAKAGASRALKLSGSPFFLLTASAAPPTRCGNPAHRADPGADPAQALLADAIARIAWPPPAARPQRARNLGRSASRIGHLAHSVGDEPAMRNAPLARTAFEQVQIPPDLEDVRAPARRAQVIEQVGLHLGLTGRAERDVALADHVKALVEPLHRADQPRHQVFGQPLPRHMIVEGIGPVGRSEQFGVGPVHSAAITPHAGANVALGQQQLKAAQRVHSRISPVSARHGAMLLGSKPGSCPALQATARPSGNTIVAEKPQ